MSYEPLDEYEHAGCQIKIYQDFDPINPREWDNLGTMVCSHRRYDLGDKQMSADLAGSFSSNEEIVEYFKEEYGATVVLPLYLFDHSGLSMSTSTKMFTMADSAGWDWGLVGFIFDTPERREAMGTPSDLIQECLVEEVLAYDQYLRGDVYGYDICRDGEFVDSCWGFFGFETVESEANAIAESINREEERIPSLKFYEMAH